MNNVIENDCSGFSWEDRLEMIVKKTSEMTDGVVQANSAEGLI